MYHLWQVQKFKKPKISYIFKKTLADFVICGKSGNEDGKTVEVEEPVEISKVLGLIKNK